MKNFANFASGETKKKKHQFFVHKKEHVTLVLHHVTNNKGSTFSHENYIETDKMNNFKSLKNFFRNKR